MTDLENNLHEAEKRILQAKADIQFQIHRLGDLLAKKHGYRNNQGIDAVHYYLMQKHNWTPSQVRSLNNDDLAFALSEDWQPSP